MSRAWYLRCGPDDVGDRAILVGDRGRVRLIATYLDDPQWLNEDRGLTTVTGGYRGARITVSAFGMGAPIAVVVMHELAELGVRAVLRLGTVMVLPPARLGDLVLADAALRGEATSATYVPSGYPASGDFALGGAVRRTVAALDRRLLAGLVASYDGFYTELFPLPEGRAAQLQGLGTVALDMETSAVLAVGRALGVRAASLCLATVDALTRDRLGEAERELGEQDLALAGLDALATFNDDDRMPA